MVVAGGGAFGRKYTTACFGFAFLADNAKSLRIDSAVWVSIAEREFRPACLPVTTGSGPSLTLLRLLRNRHDHDDLRDGRASLATAMRGLLSAFCCCGIPSSSHVQVIAGIPGESLFSFQLLLERRTDAMIGNRWMPVVVCQFWRSSQGLSAEPKIGPANFKEP